MAGLPPVRGDGCSREVAQPCASFSLPEKPAGVCSANLGRNSRALNSFLRPVPTEELPGGLKCCRSSSAGPPATWAAPPALGPQPGWWTWFRLGGGGSRAGAQEEPKRGVRERPLRSLFCTRRGG